MNKSDLVLISDLSLFYNTVRLLVMVSALPTFHPIFLYRRISEISSKRKSQAAETRFKTDITWILDNPSDSGQHYLNVETYSEDSGDDAEDSEEEISVDFDDEQRQNSRRDKINNEAADQTDLSAI
ncbi:hypothetical protein ACHWQZ_G014884 [Mnemiopsis leidyi]